MKILVTGGAGFVGTTLIPQLLEKKYQVTAIDNLMYGGTQLLPFLKYKNFKFIREDIRNKKAIKDICKDKDIIIHLAAIVGFGACRKDPKLAQEVNFVGTKNIASSISKSQYLIFSSTSTNYGAVKDGICTEETVLNPQSIYGKTKTAAEIYLMNNTNGVSFRFATGFGVAPRLRLDLLINEFVYQAVTQKYLVVYESHFLRSFIHVYDMARAFLVAIDKISKMRNKVYNVGSEKMNFSKKDICELIKKKTGAYIHYADVGKDADKRNYFVSYEKIKKMGFETVKSIDVGIDELITAVSLVQINNPYLNI